MIFRKYDTIENVYNTEFINKIFSERKSSGSWVVHEKIHGSNFSIWYDGSEVQFASRSGFIGDTCSPVTKPPFPGAPDFPQIAKDWVKGMVAKGMQVSNSVDFLA